MARLHRRLRPQIAITIDAGLLERIDGDCAPFRFGSRSARIERLIREALAARDRAAERSAVRWRKRQTPAALRAARRDWEGGAA